ncbi:MAG: nucleoid-associated protein, partial [Carnobacterium sp.]
MIYIKEAILHIFDLNNNEPIFSFAGLDLTEKFTFDYLHAMIEKVEDSDNMKTGVLSENNPLIHSFNALQDDFIETTKSLTEKLFSITKLNPEIPPADLLFVSFTLDEQPCLGLFKLNYSDSITHYISYEEDTLTNQL